jgi:hypothetical protein
MSLGNCLQSRHATLYKISFRLGVDAMQLRSFRRLLTRHESVVPWVVGILAPFLLER